MNRIMATLIQIGIALGPGSGALPAGFSLTEGGTGQDNSLHLASAPQQPGSLLMETPVAPVTASNVSAHCRKSRAVNWPSVLCQEPPRALPGSSLNSGL